jgi:acetyl esterase
MKYIFLLIFLACFAGLSSAYAQSQGALPDSFVYRQAGNFSLKAYVFKPAVSGDHRPAILLFHGGAWRIGDASWVFDRAKQFADKGIVAIAIEYRLANNGLTPIEGVDDACTAFAWARKQARKLGIDPKRVAGYGVSAGGHLVAAAGTLPTVNGKKVSENERPSVMVLYSPALNMGPDPYFIGLMAKKAPASDYSPSAYITKKLPPTMIIQGEQDSIVFAKDARAFREAAVKAGAKCTLYIYPNVGHLLTRNLSVQYKDFAATPEDMADAKKKEDDFLVAMGYIRK